MNREKKILKLKKKMKKYKKFIKWARNKISDIKEDLMLIEVGYK